MSNHSQHTSPADQLSALASHYEQAQHWQLSTLFNSDEKRFDRFSFEAAGLFLDFTNKIFYNTPNSATDQVIAVKRICREVLCVHLIWLPETKKIPPGLGQIFCVNF